jgi:hypothetical protein
LLNKSHIVFGLWQQHLYNAWIGQGRYNEEKKQQEEHDVVQR